MEEDLLAKARDEMDAVIEMVTGDLATVKTGRAKPDLLERIQVEAYDTRMSLLELATISAPDPRLLLVQPWDESIIANIEKAIATSELNLNPNVDGNVIRIPIPVLTEERREELVKLVGQKVESGKVLLRQARQDIKKEIEGLEGQPGVSEDDIHRMMEELEKITEEFVKKVEELGEQKKGELMTV